MQEGQLLSHPPLTVRSILINHVSSKVGFMVCCRNSSDAQHGEAGEAVRIALRPGWVPVWAPRAIVFARCAVSGFQACRRRSSWFSHPSAESDGPHRLRMHDRQLRPSNDARWRCWDRPALPVPSFALSADPWPRQQDWVSGRISICSPWSCWLASEVYSLAV